MSQFLTLDDRIVIQTKLTEHKSFGEIARIINKDRTTIAKEIRKRHCTETTGYGNSPYNSCVYRNSCKLEQICGYDCQYKRKRKCSTCYSCNSICKHYVEEFCTALSKPPYVCNGCINLYHCTLKKHFYRAQAAQSCAEKKIHDSRSGAQCTSVEMQRINDIVSPLVKQGHSLHNIFVSYADVLMCCEKTLYNYVDGLYLEVRNIDLPRKVKFRPHKAGHTGKVDTKCREKRTYADFLEFIAKNPDIHIVQMDSVIGARGGKVLLTIHFVELCFMLAFLRDVNTARSVSDIFNMLDYILGPELFEKMFPVILTDNGSEFSNPVAVERRDPKELDYLDQECARRRTRIFYCDPMAPYQKGAIEVNHELIRRILPKGKSFDNLEQEDINLMMNHINSYQRGKLNGNSPYEMFKLCFGEETLELLGCKEIPVNEINLTPNLFKK